MSEEDWTIVSKPTAAATKWAEEEEDDVKENWDDEDEDVSKSSSNADSGAVPSSDGQPKVAINAKKKKQKALKEKLAQKELEEQNKPKTAEELMEEKLERQRLQEESDLALAQDAFGVSTSGSDASVLGSIQLATRNDFDNFRKELTTKLSSYQRSPHYIPFLEDLFRDIAVGLESDDIKKLDTVLTSIFNEKIKEKKQQNKGKKPKKTANEIRMERDGDYSYGNNNNYDEFQDFL